MFRVSAITFSFASDSPHEPLVNVSERPILKRTSIGLETRKYTYPLPQLGMIATGAYFVDLFLVLLQLLYVRLELFSISAASAH